MRVCKPTVFAGLIIGVVAASAAQAAAPANRGTLTCEVTSVDSPPDGKAPGPAREDVIEIEITPTAGFVITPKTIALKKTEILEKPGVVRKPGSGWSHSESIDLKLDRTTGKLHTVHTLHGRIMRKNGEIASFETTETVDGTCDQTSGPAGLITAPAK